MTQPWWKVTNAWNKKYMLLQATHWLECMLPTGPKLKEKTWCWTQCWIGWRHRSRQSLKILLAEHASSEEGNLILCDWQNFTLFISGPCTCTWCLRVRPKISCSSWSPRHIMLPLWMGATKMQAIKGVTEPCPCCGNISGGWEWLTKCQKSIKSCAHCLQHKVMIVKGTPTPSDCIHCTPVDLLHVDFTSIETTMELNRPPKVVNILVFQDHFTKHHYGVCDLLTRLHKDSCQVSVSGLHLNLWGPSQAPKWSQCELHEQHY